MFLMIRIDPDRDGGFVLQRPSAGQFHLANLAWALLSLGSYIYNVHWLLMGDFLINLKWPLFASYQSLTGQSRVLTGVGQEGGGRLAGPPAHQIIRPGLSSHSFLYLCNYLSKF